MTILFVFFGLVILLEVVTLVGIVVAWKKLHQYHLEVRDAKIKLMDYRTLFYKQLRQGKLTLQQVMDILSSFERSLPWWIRSLFVAARTVSRMKQQTS